MGEQMNRMFPYCDNQNKTTLFSVFFIWIGLHLEIFVLGFPEYTKKTISWQHTICKIYICKNVFPTHGVYKKIHLGLLWKEQETVRTVIRPSY